jgi:hypothetical protein
MSLKAFEVIFQAEFGCYLQAEGGPKPTLGDVLYNHERDDVFYVGMGDNPIVASAESITATLNALIQEHGSNALLEDLLSPDALAEAKRDYGA